MRRNKLIELLTKLKELEIDAKGISNIEHLTDEDIDMILSSKYPNLVLGLLTSIRFTKKATIEMQREIINIINSIDNPEIADYCYWIVRSNQMIDDYAKSIEVLKVMKGAKGIEQVRATSKIFDKILLVDELSKEDYAALLKPICEAVSKEIAEIASNVAVSEQVYESGCLVEAVASVASSKTVRNASYAAAAALNEKILKTYKKQVKTIFGYLASEESLEKLEILYSVVMDDVAINSGHLGEYANIISFGAIRMENAYRAAEMATNRMVVSNKDGVELTCIIAKTNGAYQLEYANYLATDEAILDSGHALDIVRAASKVEDNEIISVDDSVMQDIKQSQYYKRDNEAYLRSLSLRLNVVMNFWDIFRRRDPNYALYLFEQDNFDEGAEIKPDTKVRAKIKDTN